MFSFLLCLPPSLFPTHRHHHHQVLPLPSSSVSPHLLTILSTCHLRWYFGIYLPVCSKWQVDGGSLLCSPVETRAIEWEQCCYGGVQSHTESRACLINVTQLRVIIDGWEQQYVQGATTNTDQQHKTPTRTTTLRGKMKQAEEETGRRKTKQAEETGRRKTDRQSDRQTMEQSTQQQKRTPQQQNVATDLRALLRAPDDAEAVAGLLAMKLHGELDHPVTLVHGTAALAPRRVARGAGGREPASSWLGGTALGHPGQVAGHRVLRLEGRALPDTARRVLTQGRGRRRAHHRPRQLPAVAAVVRRVLEGVVAPGHRRRAEVRPAAAVLRGAPVPAELHAGVGRVAAAGPEVGAAVWVGGGHGGLAAHVLGRGGLGPVGVRAVVRPRSAPRHHLRARSPTPELARLCLPRVPVPVAIVPSPSTRVARPAVPVPVPVLRPAARVQPHVVVAKRVHTRSRRWASTLIKAFHVIAVCAWFTLISMLVRHFLGEFRHMILHGRSIVLWIHVQVSAVVERPIAALVPIAVRCRCLGAILQGSFGARFRVVWRGGGSLGAGVFTVWPRRVNLIPIWNGRQT